MRFELFRRKPLALTNSLRKGDKALILDPVCTVPMVRLGYGSAHFVIASCVKSPLRFLSDPNSLGGPPL